MTRQKGSAAGVAVDAQGGPAVDPTQNVLDLVNAAIQRQDDLRESEATHLREMAALRAQFEDKLRATETARIDAIRAVDVDAVRRAAEVQATAALALQAQVAASAEAVRVQLAFTNTQFAESLATGLKTLADAIATLQAQQWKDSGQRQQVVEARDVRGDTRLNVGAIFGGVSVLLVLVFGIASLWVTFQ